MKKIRNMLIATAGFVLLLCAASATGLAVSVWGEVLSYEQPDGTTVDVKVYGDEFYRWAESPDGYTLIDDPQTGYMCYAQFNTDGSDLESTGVIFTGDLQDRTSNIGFIPKGLRLDDTVIDQKVQAAKTAMGVSEDWDSNENDSEEPNRAAVPGILDIIKGITIVIDFDDTGNTAFYQIDDIWHYLNTPGYSNHYNKGSIYDYFYDVSNGVVRYNNEVFYYKAPKNKEWYNEDKTYERLDNLVIAALEALRDNDSDFRACLPTLTQKDGTVRALNMVIVANSIETL